MLTKNRRVQRSEFHYDSISWKIDRYKQIRLYQSKIARPLHFIIGMFYCTKLNAERFISS